MIRERMFFVFWSIFLAITRISGEKDTLQSTSRPIMEVEKQDLPSEMPIFYSQHVNVSQLVTLPISTIIHPVTIDENAPSDNPPNVSTKVTTVPNQVIPRYTTEVENIGTELVTHNIKLLGNITETHASNSEDRRIPINTIGIVDKSKNLAQQNISQISEDISTFPSVNVSVTKHQEVRCPSEKDNDIWWNDRKVGTLAVQPCTTGYHGNIYRRCYVGGIWGTADYTDCKLERLQRLGHLVLYHLHKRLLTGLYHLAEELADYLPVANILSPVDRLQTIDVLEKMLIAEVNLRADSDSDVAYVADLLQCADELLTRKVITFPSTSERNYLLSTKSAQAILGLEILAQKALHSLLGIERRALVFRSSQNIVMSLFSKQTSIDHIWPNNNSTEDKDEYFPTFLNIEYSDVENMAFAFIWIQHLGKILNTARVMLNSDVVIATAITSVSPQPIPFEVTLKMNKVQNEGEYVHGCATLQNSSKVWSTERCHVMFRKKDTVTCHCDDLCAVALVLQKSEKIIKEYPSHSFSRVIVASCGVSFIAVVLTLMANLHRYRKNCPESSPILLNLLIAMATIQVVFMAGINATQHEEICYSISITLHYLSLVASFWMVSFTIQLYRRLRKSSQKVDLKKIIRSYFLLSWTVPIALVTISFTINPRGYETRRYCWLSIQRGMLISFIVPMSLLILINTVFMILVLKTFFQQRPVTHMSEIEKTRVSLRAGVTLLPFFAVNWFFGVLALEDTSTTIFQYAFAFTNSLQGILIFIFYCCMDIEVRRSLKTKFVRRKKKRRNSAIKLKRGCFLCSREQSVISLDEEGGRPLLAEGPAATSLQTEQENDKLQNFVHSYSV